MASKVNGIHKAPKKNVPEMKKKIARIIVDIEPLKDEVQDIRSIVEQLPEEKKMWQEILLPPYNLSAYAEDSLQALNIKLVRSPEDLEDDETTFHPQLTYQTFGESENVVGYKGADMKLYYTAGSLATYFNFTYKEKCNFPFPYDLKPDDLTQLVGSKLQANYHTEMSEFLKEIEKDKDFRPPGTLVNQFTTESDEDGELCFEIYSATVSTPGFASYHERLQTFLLWYIEAASFIDMEDDKWKTFLMFEKYEQDGKDRYATVGYLTVYEFFCYPNNLRPRISQMLILPPFQSQGLGAKLLETAFTHYRELPEVTDIAVESPSEEFQRMRDFIDCKVCAKMSSFTPAKLKKGFSKEMELEAKEKLKMSKKQAQRVFNILRLGQVNEDNPMDLDRYIKILRKQVDRPHQVMLARAKRKKLFERISMKRIMEAMPSLSEMYRESLLNQATDIMLEQYRKVLERLERD